MIDQLIGYFKQQLNNKEINVLTLYKRLFNFRNPFVDELADLINKNAFGLIQTEPFLNLSSECIIKLIQNKDFLVPELDIYKIVKNWIDKNKGKCPHDILNQIRLELIDVKSLFDIKKDELFDKQLIIDALEKSFENGKLLIINLNKIFK